MFYNFSVFLHFRFSKKPSMSRNIRLCTHRCAKCWLKKLRILIPLIAMPAPSSGCCSTSVAWSSRTVFRSPSSMKSTPGEISRLNFASFPATFFPRFFFYMIYYFCNSYDKDGKVEEDAKYMAKRKMLGNIKFMGELGKMEIVHDTILHRYVEL